MNYLEDTFITGMVRQRIEGAKIEILDVGFTSFIWNKLLLRCPFLNLAKSGFLNKVVLKKNEYIGNLRFGLCCTYEYVVLYRLVQIGAAHLVPHFLFDTCWRE